MYDISNIPIHFRYNLNYLNNLKSINQILKTQQIPLHLSESKTQQPQELNQKQITQANEISKSSKLQALQSQCVGYEYFINPNNPNLYTNCTATTNDTIEIHADATISSTYANRALYARIMYRDPSGTPQSINSVNYTVPSSGGTVIFAVTLPALAAGTYSTYGFDVWDPSTSPPTQVCTIIPGTGSGLCESLNITSAGGGCPALVVPGVTCPGSVTQGSPATFNISWSGGVSPYTVELWNDTDTSAPSIRLTNITGTSTSGTVPGNITSGWTAGNHTMYPVVQDSCSPNNQFKQGQCSFSVTSGGGCPAFTGANTGCPGGTLTRGTQVNFSPSWSGGQAPFTASILEGGSANRVIGQVGNISSTSATVPVIIDSVLNASNPMILVVQDSCNQSYQAPDCFITVSGGGGVSGYNCVSGNCQYVTTNAQYTTLSACQSACTPSGGVGWNCSGSPGYTCLQATSGTGQYATQADCLNACKATGGTSGCTNCDPNLNYCLVGQCIKKNYVLYATLGFGALFILSILK